MSETDLRLLTLAGEVFDLAEDARRTLAKEGSVYTDDKGHVHAHPAVLIARDNRTLFARLIRDLHLDGPQQPAPGPIGRPPGIVSPRTVVRKDGA